MKYTEAPDAQQQLQQFSKHCDEHQIKCDGFHLSSGYTACEQPDGSDGPRCVFTWNTRKFPEPDTAFDHFQRRAIHVLPNIKPWLLKGVHPDYDVATTAGCCLKQSDVEPYVGLFWAGAAGTFRQGSYIDFSSPAGFRWWRDKCNTQLLAKGATALWNDNNEYEVDDGQLICANGLRMAVMKPIQALLMAMSSLEALKTAFPDKRPVVVTRSGCPGMHRLCAQTWSGDNRTSWESLQWNTPMGLSLGLCGWPGNGHDVGGFAGPMPQPELLVRWVQSCMLQPRFSIHSWNDDGTCTEPWSYPSHTPTIKACIDNRYTHIPFLYDLFHVTASTGIPVTRPLALHFGDDPVVCSDNLKRVGVYAFLNACFLCGSVVVVYILLFDYYYHYLMFSWLMALLLFHWFIVVLLLFYWLMMLVLMLVLGGSRGDPSCGLIYTNQLGCMH
eukprot:m.120507 g.120507  ORF g.120507 m.120507 type:complete len:442 (-) comp13691_c0_seq4:3392-4717(-)